MSGVKNSYLKQRDDLEMKMLSTRSNRASSTIKAKKRKIVVLGKLGVGKTSLIRRYIDNIFPEKVLNQSEETFTKNIVYKKEEIKLVLLDTIGQNEFTPFLQNKYCIGVHGYILIYAINDNNSFEAIQHINNILLDAMGSKYVPRIIVGSKKDLETERDVSQERLNKFANQTKAPCIECSALNGNDDLDNIIYKLIKEINKETNDQYPYNIKNSMIHMNFIRNNHNLFNQLLIGFQIVLIIFGLIFLAFIIFLWIKIKISFDFKLFFNIISSVLNIINAVTGINAIKLSNYLKMKNFLFVLVLNIVMNIIIITTLFTGSSNLLQLIKNENNHIEYLIISILILILQISSMYICINLTPLYEEFQNSKSMNENLIFRV